jgi:hypothetical protein
MASVQLDGGKIADWNSFHGECQGTFGFPEFYGRNMDAWIDCLSTLRDDDRMTKFKLGPDETLEIRLLHSGVLRRQAPNILGALEECMMAVNERYVEHGEKPALTLELL